MSLFLQTIINGLVTGAVYGWLAVGLSIVFLSSGILNFSGASAMVLAGYVVYWLTPHVGAIGAALIAAGSGLAVGAISRLIIRGDSWRGTLISVGLFIVITGFIPAVFGNSTVEPTGLLGQRVLRIDGAAFTGDQMLLLALFIATGVALGLVLSKSVVGWKLRAAAESTADVERLGINASRLIASCFLIAGLIWALGGLLIVPITGFDPTTSGNYLGYGLTALVVGGATDPFAALFGGLALGLVAAFSESYISSLIGPTSAFVVLLFALALRPRLVRRFMHGARLATQNEVRI